MNIHYALGNGKISQNNYLYGMPLKFETNGVQNLTMDWDYKNGNLLSRYDAQKNKKEFFKYDNLDRLTSAQIEGRSANTINYANNGNINEKSDLGAYVYDINKINTIKSVTQTSNIGFSALQQDITYTSFERASKIEENNYKLLYNYGADYERTKGVLSRNGSTINTRYYVGDYELNIKHDGSTQELHYVSSPAGLIAIVVKENNTENYNYIYTDHLGSIVAVTNEAGNVIAEQNFDAWGRQRNPNTWELTSPTATATELGLPSWLYRGYTGHEMLREVGLINMNARLYDPVLGRMLSPDNFVGDGFSTQVFNRYTYANNNPLKHIDPDGNHPILMVAIISGAFISGAGYTIGLLIRDGNLNNWDLGSFTMSFFQGAIAGAISFGIGSAFQGVAAGAKGLWAAKALAHGVSSGLQSAAWSGSWDSFGTAALSGAFGSIAGGLSEGTNIGTHMLAGGAGGAFGAWISGGNILQGALTGAIVAGLNHGLHDAMDQTDETAAKKQEVKPKNSEISVKDQLGDMLDAFGLSNDVKMELMELAKSDVKMIKNYLKFFDRFSKVMGVASAGISLDNFRTEPTTANLVEFIVNTTAAFSGPYTTIGLGALSVTGYADKVYQYLGNFINNQCNCNAGLEVYKLLDIKR